MQSQPTTMSETQYGRRSMTTSDANLKPTQDIVTYFREYARERPEVVAMWCFGIGFVLGWKLKPW